MRVELRGITWNHTRGYVPMVATSQRFSEMNPEVHIAWEKRSLQEFADAPIQNLIERYDLLVIDHPWAGYAAANDILLPLDNYLPASFLANQASNAVGASHESYRFAGHQFALAIDAATPVASYREDLFQRHELTLPQTWDDVLQLADRDKVLFPGIPIDTLMNFYMFCSTLGEDPFTADRVITTETGTQALEMLREIAGKCTPQIYEWNPIKVYEALSGSDDFLYCPFAYGYSNYSRPGYAPNRLNFTDTVSLGVHGRLKTTLGGTGLAISRNCKHKDIAAAYALFTASEECQQTIYVENGGQPGHRSAWTNKLVNERCGNFFLSTLPCLDRSYLRPRYCGYMHFQDHAGDIVQEYMREGGSAQHILDRLEVLYRESKGGKAI